MHLSRRNQSIQVYTPNTLSNSHTPWSKSSLSQVPPITDHPWRPKFPRIIYSYTLYSDLPCSPSPHIHTKQNNKISTLDFPLLSCLLPPEQNLAPLLARWPFMACSDSLSGVCQYDTPLPPKPTSHVFLWLHQLYHTILRTDII